MALIDIPSRRIHAKLVYYGPEMGGKTTNLRHLARALPMADPASLRSVASQQDRTIFADTLPLDLGVVAGFRVTFELRSVAGQRRYERTRQLVLFGADGVVFVADAEAERLQENRDSLAELARFCDVGGRRYPDFPLVLQYNKMDRPGALSVDALDAALNPRDLPRRPAVAIAGAGVVETLRDACRRVVRDL